MKKKIAAIIAIIALLGTVISVSAASTTPVSASSAYLTDSLRWETTSLGANW